MKIMIMQVLELFVGDEKLWIDYGNISLGYTGIELAYIMWSVLA